MKNIIFIAPPAAGKGTQSDLLVKKYNYVHISTGDLLRAELASGSELGKELAEVMSSGALVSDEIVLELLEKKLSGENGPYIFDGYPRNIAQAKVLEDLLIKLNKTDYVVVYLKIDEELALQRATGRLSCPKCNRTYHKYFDTAKPKFENKCDDCDNDLISRSDDSEETFKVRYKNYIDNTAALLDFYKEKGLLNIFDSSNVPEQTFVEIENVAK